MKKLIVLSLGLVLIAAACNRSNTDQTNNTTPPPPAVTPPAANPPAPTPPPATGDTTIAYTSSGFSPGSVTVKKGSKVTFQNNSSGNFQPASAPHPAHTDYAGFDPKKAISAGQTWTFTFDKVGTWKYHDHLNPTRFGTVIVTE